MLMLATQPPGRKGSTQPAVQALHICGNIPEFFSASRKQGKIKGKGAEEKINPAPSFLARQTYRMNLTHMLDQLILVVAVDIAIGHAAVPIYLLLRKVHDMRGLHANRLRAARLRCYFEKVKFVGNKHQGPAVRQNRRARVVLVAVLELTQIHIIASKVLWSTCQRKVRKSKRDGVTKKETDK